MIKFLFLKRNVIKMSSISGTSRASYSESDATSSQRDQIVNSSDVNDELLLTMRDRNSFCSEDSQKLVNLLSIYRILANKELSPKQDAILIKNSRHVFSVLNNRMDRRQLTKTTEYIDTVTEISNIRNRRFWENRSSPDIYHSDDSIFKDRGGTLPVKGPCVSVEEANKAYCHVLRKYFLESGQLHKAQIFHGSSSASLIAFTAYSECEGKLLPIGILEKKGKIPFTGEILFGRSNYNQKYLSTTWIGAIDDALGYSFANLEGWTPEIGQEKLATALNILQKNCEFIPCEEKEKFQEALIAATENGDFTHFEKIKSGEILCIRKNVNQGAVNAKRLAAWEKLNDEEKQLISHPFPVLYGIRSDRENAHKIAFSGVRGEILLKQGAYRDEIKVIFVPSEKMEFVKQLLSENGHKDIAVEHLQEFWLLDHYG